MIGLNVSVFLIGLLLQRFSPDVFAEAQSQLWLHGDQLQPWSFITYQFLHGGFMHLAGNMLFLFVFGPNIEDRLGRWWYLMFYLAGGAIAGGVYAIWYPRFPVVGASASISAVTGAFLVFFPGVKIRVFVFFFFIGVFEIPAAWFIGFQIFINFFYQGSGGDGNVAYLAHIAGYAVGFGVAYSLLASSVLPREPYDLFSMGKQARRRREFRELTTKGNDPWSGRTVKKRNPIAGSKGPIVRSKKLKSFVDKVDSNDAKRYAISSLMARGELEAACKAYRKLRQEHDRPCLNRDAQMALANHSFQLGEYEDAAESYSIFLEKHSADREAPHVRLLLALVYAKYLDRPADARALLHDLPSRLTDTTERQLAQTLLADLPAAVEADG